jgi:hypothetical protein
MEEIKAPERGVVFIGKVGADSRKILADRLRDLAFEIEVDRTGGVCISGGASDSAIFEVRDTGKTHDAYIKELETYLDALKAREANGGS